MKILCHIAVVIFLAGAGCAFARLRSEPGRSITPPESQAIKAAREHLGQLCDGPVTADYFLASSSHGYQVKFENVKTTGTNAPGISNSRDGFVALDSEFQVIHTECVQAKRHRSVRLVPRRIHPTTRPTCHHAHKSTTSCLIVGTSPHKCSAKGCGSSDGYTQGA